MEGDSGGAQWTNEEHPASYLLLYI